MKKFDLEKIQSIEKPAPLKKPTKPEKPNLVGIEKTKKEETIYWSHKVTTGAGKDVDTFKIVDILKKIPEKVEVKDFVLWTKSKESGSVYDYNRKLTTEICVGVLKETPNPKYDEVQKKYEVALAAYEVEHSEWEKAAEDYEERVELYNRFKEIIDVRDQKKAMLKKLAAFAGEVK